MPTTNFYFKRFSLLLFLILSFSFLGIFLFSKVANAAVIINELLPNPAGSDEAEWIELKNTGLEDVDLDGWRISDKSKSYTISSSDFATTTILAGEFFLLEKSKTKIALNNSGEETVSLLDGADNLIDEVTYIGPAQENTSYARDKEHNWHWTASLTPLEENIINNFSDERSDIKTKSEGDSGLEQEGNSVIINELFPNPTGSDEAEWIELKNVGEKNVNLVNWRISDLSGKTYVISSDDFATTTILAGGFLLLPKSRTGIALNNAGGDTVRLFDLGGNLVSEVSYLESTQDGLSWARDEQGIWYWTTTPTPLEENVITQPTAPEPVNGGGGGSSGAGAKKNYTKQIKINEILPNALGADQGSLGKDDKPFDQGKILNNELLIPELGEWIELKSFDNAINSLAGWKITNKSGEYIIKENDFKSVYAWPNDFFILPRFITGLRLKNSGGDEIKLFDPAGNLVDSVKYSGTADENEAYMANKDGKWQWTITPTPCRENIYTKKNLPPHAYFEILGDWLVGSKIIFDATESYDPEGEDLKYFWEFENEAVINGLATTTLATTSPVIELSFSRPGSFKIKLQAEDVDGQSDEYEQTLILSFNPKDIPDVRELKITEFLPDPVGRDETGEWIEIFNNSDHKIDLSYFKLDDMEGGSPPYTFKETVIPAKSYLVIKRSQSRIALNNDYDSLRLFDPAGKLLQEVDYDDAETGLSYALNEKGEWFWTSKATPGEKNIIEEAVDNLQLSSQRKTQGKQLAAKKYIPILKVDLEDLRELDPGTRVQVQGVVSVEPGTLGASIFYLAGSGVQVYCYKKDFPGLAIGDVIQVTGTLGRYYNETRIKIKDKNSIKIIDSGRPPDPEQVSLDEISDEIVGSLIKVFGEVTSIKRDDFWLDDGGGEIKVTIKRSTDIDLEKLNLDIGDHVEVIGILSQTQSGFRILPRSKEDVKVQKILGEAVAENSKTQEHKNTVNILKYLLTFAVAVILVMGVIIVKLMTLAKKTKM